MPSLATIVVCLLLIACGDSDNKPKNSAAKDTISNSNKTETDTMPTPTPPKPSLAPGQVKVIGKVISLETADTPGTQVMKLSVISVSQYGASTTPIAVNDTISITGVSIDRLKKEIESGDKITTIIQQNIPSKGSNIPQWSMVKLD